jgi:RNA polymerase sigma factor (sigma-70 family)
VPVTGGDLAEFGCGEDGFRQFVSATEPRLRIALMATYGTDRGREATAEALALCWERWEQVRKMSNPVGWCFRVGQSKTRSRKTPVTYLRPERDEHEDPWVEPRLPEALTKLPQRQRLVVVLVHGYGYGVAEVASLLGIGPATVRTHLGRGLNSLRRALVADEVTHDR